MADEIVNVPAVYRIVNNVNGKCYVGSSVKVKSRWKTHLKELAAGRHHSSKLQRAWNKYGPDAFSFEIHEVVSDVDLLLVVEQKVIDEYDAAQSGYNVLPKAGSHLGAKRTDETRDKLSAANIGKKHSEATRKKISEAGRGRKHSDEHRQKMREAMTGRVFTDEHLEKLAAAREKMFTPEVRKKISDRAKARGILPATRDAATKANTGRKPSCDSVEKRIAHLRGVSLSADHKKKIGLANKGKIRTEETRRKLSEAHLGKRPDPEMLIRRNAAIKAAWARRKAGLMEQA